MSKTKKLKLCYQIFPTFLGKVLSVVAKVCEIYKATANCGTAVLVGQQLCAWYMW